MDIRKELTKYIPPKLIDDLAEYLSFSHLMHVGVHDGCVELLFNFGHNPKLCEDFWRANWKLISDSNRVNINYSIKLESHQNHESIFEKMYGVHIKRVRPNSERYFDEIEFKIRGVVTNIKQEGKVISLDDEDIKIIPSKAKQTPFSLDPEKLEKSFRLETIGKIKIPQHLHSYSKEIWSAVQKAENDFASTMMYGIYEREYDNRSIDEKPKRIAVLSEYRRCFDDFINNRSVIGIPERYNQYLWVRDEGDLRGCRGYDDFIVLDVPRQLERMLYMSGQSLPNFMNRFMINPFIDKKYVDRVMGIAPKQIPKKFL